jgi:acetolactate synthase-1/2/3 large subunit
MRVADWIAEYLHSIGVRRVHGLMGGGAAGLNDGFIKHGGIEYICYHHEQGAGHAAIGEAKYTGKLAVVNPTTGCGGTNCATSVLNAWQDGVPVLFISGNVRRDTCTTHINHVTGLRLRHYGLQEHDIAQTYRNMSKFSVFANDAEDAWYYLDKAVHMATSGRPGPVWIDIPIDVQQAEITGKPVPHHIIEANIPKDEKVGYIFNPTTVWQDMKNAKRPIILAGMGIRQSGCIEQFVQFVTKYEIPFVTTYGAQDYLPYDHPLNMGTIGSRGTRFGNFAMQNADLLLILGTSMNAGVIGYDPKQFSPQSRKIYVDIDTNELSKNIVPVDHKIAVPLDQFFGVMI